MPEPIIIDTDPGIDDAMAILFALRCPELEILALTTVFGNHYIEVTTRNALRLLELAGREDIPVARGAGAPLVRPFAGPAELVHGHDGLGDANLTGEPEHDVHHSRAAQFIVETVMSHPGEITLVPLGPLTNIALALKLEPRLPQFVRRVVLMGGAAFVPGNITPVAEANIYNDPEAAAIVFAADWDVTMIGLDVTMQVIMDPHYLQELAASGSAYSNLIARIVPTYQRFHQEYYRNDGALHTHDPSAVVYLIAPHLFKTTPYRIRIETQGLASGLVVVDRYDKWFDGVKTSIAVDVNSQAVLDLYRERIASQ